MLKGREPDPQDPEIINRMTLRWSYKPIPSIAEHFQEPYLRPLIESYAFERSFIQICEESSITERASSSRRVTLHPQSSEDVARSVPTDNRGQGSFPRR